jgi:hypothetical protein
MNQRIVASSVLPISVARYRTGPRSASAALRSPGIRPARQLSRDKLRQRPIEHYGRI